MSTILQIKNHFLQAVIAAIFAQNLLSATENREVFFKFAEFYSGSEFSIPIDKISEDKNKFILQSEAEKNNTSSGYKCKTLYQASGYFKVKNSTGIHLAFKAADIKAYSTFPATEFSFFQKNYEQTGLKKTIYKSLQNFEQHRAAVAIYAGNFSSIPLPLTVKAGSLSYSQSISRMKNPATTGSMNALSGISFGLTGIGSSLPTSSSGKKQNSLALTFFPAPFNLECALFEDRTLFYSAGTIFKFGKNAKLSTAFSGARIFIQKKNSSSWYLTEEFFPPEWEHAFLWENTFYCPGIKNKLSIGVHENPFSRLRFWMKNENRTILGPVLLNTQFFAADRFFLTEENSAFYTAGSTLEKTVLQIKINPQYTCNLWQNIRCSFGLLGMAEKNKESLNPCKEKTELGTGSAAKFFTEKSTFLISAAVTGILYEKSEYAENSSQKNSISLEGSHSFSSWKATARTKFTSTESSDGSRQSQSFAFNASFPGKTVSSVSASFEKAELVSGDKQKLSCTVNFKESNGKIRFRGKIKLNVDF